MNQTTVEVFQKAAVLCLKLGFEPPDTLRIQPACKCLWGSGILWLMAICSRTVRERADGISQRSSFQAKRDEQSIVFA